MADFVHFLGLLGHKNPYVKIYWAETSKEYVDWQY